MPLTGPPRATFFYPRIVGGGFTIDFPDPAEAVGPFEIPVGLENISDNGTRERLHQRFEDRVALRFRYVDVATMKTVRNWWRQHAGLGKQSVLTLDVQSIPTAPTAAAGAAGNVDVGAHSWTVTFLINAGETAPGPKSNVLTITASPKQVNLSAVPTGPRGTTGRKIYRTVAGDTGSHLLVGTINDNTTTTFLDNVADASLGAAAPSAPNIGVAEYDIYNTTFTKAELLNNPFQAPRPLFGRALYALELIFRQGL
jgi:hypothetical protein